MEESARAGREVVSFPLRGEWVAFHTPADQVPSHGTDRLGQRYAYDFLRIDRDRDGWEFSRTPPWRFRLVGARLKDCYGWGEPIHSPFAGTAVAAYDGVPERDPVHIMRDLAVALKNALFGKISNTEGLRPLLGNHLILKAASGEIYALIAHAKTGSVRVRSGETVGVGQHIADVGHSGNSTAPHLHFQLMDGPDLLTASGLPCAFERYETLRDGIWVDVREEIPMKREFIRSEG